MEHEIINSLSGDIVVIRLVNSGKLLELQGMYQGNEYGGCREEIFLKKSEAKQFIQELTDLVDQMEE